MIYLDRVGYSFLVKEIKDKIQGLKLRKIQSHDNNSFSLLFNGANLYFENKGEAIVYLKEKKVENTNREINFVLKLKKEILSAIVTDVFLAYDDRIVNISFEKLDLLNNTKKYNLIYEFLGKNVNVILTNEDNIVLTTLYPSISNRVLLKGAKYESPDNTNKALKYFDNLSENEKNKFLTSYRAIIYENNFLTYNDFLKDKSKTEYESLNKALNVYFENLYNISQIESKRKPILKYIRRNIKRLNKILFKIPEDRKENQNYEIYKKKADILLANLYKIERGMGKISLFDYYENKEIEILLDKNLSPTKNVEKLYLIYSKLKRKEVALKKREIEVKEELSYYEEQEIFTLNEKELIGFEEIEKELGIVNEKIRSNKKEKRKIKPVNYMGYDIYVGRNSSENEEITFKIADKNDLWLHAKDVPGSHVIIKGKDIPYKVIEYAAELALVNSKLKGSGDVDYTIRKNVTKIPLAKRANVKYTNYNTIRIK